MNIHEIYGLLLAGRKLELKFPSMYEAGRFRIRLHQIKKTEDKKMLAVGMMEDSEKQSFRFAAQADLITGEVTASLQFVDKDVAKQYEVKIIDDETDGGIQENVA
jgi:hypothetical protein